ncbi:MAG TPA: DinB family protein [Thermoanaerobaculia bacterium]|nr:DinB family protein [Thermoanaerobaculia bacterium]
MNVTNEVTRDLFRHMQWADAEMWRTLLAHPSALEDEKLFKLVQHLHAVQRAFHLMWTGGAIDGKALYAKKDPATMVAEAREWYATAAAYLDAFDEARNGETLHMPWLPHFEKQLGRTLQHPTYGETFLQLPMHSGYHRGQVNLLLRQLGGEPANVDYIAWIWFGRPEPQWP